MIDQTSQGQLVLWIVFGTGAAILLALLVAHLRHHLVDVLRAAGEAALGVFAAILHGIVHMLDGVSLLLSRAWRGLRDHYGPTKDSIDHWAGWSAILPLIALGLLIVNVAAEYTFASRIGYMLGLPPNTNIHLLDSLLGVLYVSMMATIAWGLADCHNLTPSGHSILWARLSDEGRARVAKWLLFAFALVLFDAIVLAWWSAEAALAGVNDIPLATLFLIVFSLLIAVAEAIVALPALAAVGVLWAFALSILLLALFLLGTALWVIAYILARLVNLLEKIVELLAGAGRKLWNGVAARYRLKPLDDPAPLPLIGWDTPRPRLIHSSTTDLTPTSMAAGLEARRDDPPPERMSEA